MRIAIAGVLASVLLGGSELVELLSNGVQRTDLINTPDGVLARFLAGLFTSAPSLISAGSERRHWAYLLFVIWHVLVLLLYCAALAQLRSRYRRPTRLTSAVLVLQMVAGAMSLSPLLFVLSAQLRLVFPLKRGLKWMAGLALLQLGVFVYTMRFRGLAFGDDMVRLGFLYYGFATTFQMLAFGAAHLALRERQARATLAAANARLLATQSMLADTVRASERLRIARDLHDAVGHHLTALNLHLDLALRQAGASAPQALGTSCELARSLLAEVRSVVSNERSEQRIDLAAAIATLCSGIPEPAIRLDFDEPLEIDSAALAHTLFFCVQEALTNAVRHSGAKLLTIAIRRRGASLQLLVADDGCGMQDGAEGNGLRGMRERVAERGGTLSTRTSRAAGYGLDIAMPLAWSGA